MQSSIITRYNGAAQLGDDEASALLDGCAMNVWKWITGRETQQHVQLVPVAPTNNLRLMLPGSAQVLELNSGGMA